MSHASGRKNSSHGGFIFFQTIVVFTPIFKYFAVFQGQSEDYIGDRGR